ncbi:MAG: hypothetical protein AAGC45_03030 [Bacteroidota bacterium]
MVKYAFWLIVLVWVSSCKDTSAEAVDPAQEPDAFSIQDYPKLIEMDPEVFTVVSSWPEFMAMENSFDVLKRASNTEDLKLAVDDLIEREKALGEGDYPEAFDKLQIKSRQQLLRTFLYKVRGNLLDNRDISEGMEELINAYNSLKNQLNVIGGNTLDAELILNEE